MVKPMDSQQEYVLRAVEERDIRIVRLWFSDILGPDDDITLFEYLKRNNRETGTALIGLQLGRASDFDGLVERMNASRIDCRHLKPGTPEYEFVVS